MQSLGDQEQMKDHTDDNGNDSDATIIYSVENWSDSDNQPLAQLKDATITDAPPGKLNVKFFGLSKKHKKGRAFTCDKCGKQKCLHWVNHLQQAAKCSSMSLRTALLAQAGGTVFGIVASTPENIDDLEMKKIVLWNIATPTEHR